MQTDPRTPFRRARISAVIPLKIDEVLGLGIGAMRRRSRAGSLVKVRRRKSVTLRRPNASKPARSRTSSGDGLKSTAVRLTRELNEAREQQAATADVLKVISRSTFNLQVVLDTLVESAVRLCEADMACIVRPQGSHVQFLATYGFSQAFVEVATSTPVAPGRWTLSGRVLAEGRTVRIPDVLADPEYTFTVAQKVAGFRSGLGVPLMREGTPVGVMNLWRSEVRPFTDKQIELVTTFADQAVIAIENTRLLNELRELLEQQTATADVLKVISSSPGDLQPVFDAMLVSATRLCQASYGTMWLRESDGQMRVAARHGDLPEAFRDQWHIGRVFRPSPSVATARVFETRKLVHVVDLKEDRSYFDRDPLAVAAVEVAGIRTLISVPMLKEGEVVGTLNVYRREVRPFTDKQIELVENFAAQAVIAIENARLLNELRERTADLTELLEQQTATSEVLSVISRSPGELETVFRSMLENAVKICQAKFGFMLRYDGDAYRTVAELCDVPAYVEEMRRGPLRPHPDSALGSVARTRQVTQIADITAHQLYAERNPLFVAGAELGGIRTIVAVPMLKDQQLIGTITIFRQEVRPFTEKQIALVENFAAQAVIAIENTRLLNELRELLGRQTATAEVLRVISSSPGELEPVFQAMLENATRICEAEFGNLWLAKDGGFQLAATYGLPSEFQDQVQRKLVLYPGPTLPIARAAGTREPVHILDPHTDPSYVEREPIATVGVERGQVRTMVAVPMLKDRDVVGVFAILRQEVRPFADKQIELLQNFAAQAVIAIENARLLNELRQRTSDLTEF